MPKDLKKIIHKKFDVEIKGVDKENNTLEAIFSTQGEDRHGDVVVQTGWDLKNFKKNPVILNSHNHNDATEVIGKVEKGTLKIEKGKLQGKIKFAIEENPKAKIIYDLYAGGYLNAFSVGFMALEYDAKDFSKIIKSELLEVSAVSVPANAYALAKEKGIEVDKLYDKSKQKSEGEGNEDNDEDKKDKETIETDSDSSEEAGGEDTTETTEPVEGVSDKTEEEESGKVDTTDNDKPGNEEKEEPVEEPKPEQENNDIQELRAEITELKGIVSKLAEKKVSKEDKIKTIIKKYKNSKLSSLAKINEAVAIVGNHYKGQKSNDSKNNNHLVNSAVKELLKLKD